MVRVFHSALLSFLTVPGRAFMSPSSSAIRNRAAVSLLAMVSTSSASETVHSDGDGVVVGQNKKEVLFSSKCLVDPSARDSYYGSNIAQYLVDLHDNQATFDFCGGMLFQLVLSDRLRSHLGQVAAAFKQEQQEQQLKIFTANYRRMHQIPQYSQSSQADNVQIFHGREIRSVPHAKGGMGFVLQLSMAAGVESNDDQDPDPEGWSESEMTEYNGWMHDTGRTWRIVQDWQTEQQQQQQQPKQQQPGDAVTNQPYTTPTTANFVEKFGSQAFGLHHRFYLHFDEQQRMWLSAEDGCEGTPAITM